MKTMRTAIGLGLLLACLLPACSGEEIQGVCKRDGDCDTGFFCSADFQCLCRDDTACAADQFCNSAGRCQKILGCRADMDCGDAAAWRCEFSESGSGQCLCRTDAACEAGEYCNTSGSCQQKVGCILDADCGDAAAWRCRINPDTSIGECFCKTDAACEQSEFCNGAGFCQPLATCSSNDDCPAGRFCNVASGECLCNSEAQTGCGPEEVCNASGYCQPRPGCYDNRDCENLAGTYCDITTRTCLPEGTCSSDRQCPLGQVCRQYHCVTGCDLSEDCPLDQYCNASYQCVSGCQDDSFCPFTHYCTAGTCQDAYSSQTPFCKPCDGQSTDPNQCGDPDNWCIIYNNGPDDFSAHSSEYCGPDCSVNGRCPNGYSCGELIIISGQCPAGCGASGATNCSGGLPCIKGPEEQCGFCPCHDTINPCPSNTCETMFLHMCMATGKPCSSNADCVQPTCEKFDGEQYGYCVIGNTCGINEGLHCPYPPR